MEALYEIAQNMRIEILSMINKVGKGHIGGSFSCVDMLAFLYLSDYFKLNKNFVNKEERDVFILSKGHAALALYVTLNRAGILLDETLKTYGCDASTLGAHPDNKISGVEVNTGALGHGIGIATGMALADKLDGRDNAILVMLGDGECYEGSVWEAAQFAAHHKLSNLIVIIDRNKQCVLDFTEKCNIMEPFADKWRAFGWEVAEINGHSFSNMQEVFLQIRQRAHPKKPFVIIAHTIKGKGVSFMEGNVVWHHKVPKGEEFILADKELRDSLGR